MKKALMLAAVTAIGFGATSAMAQDSVVGETQRLPGMLCRPMSGGVPSVGWQAWMRNVSTTPNDNLQVLCPIVWDGSLSSLDVNFLNTIPSNVTASCQFFTVDANTVNVAWWESRIAGPGGPTTTFQLSIPSGGFDFYGTASLFCSIPPMSNGFSAAVVSYTTTQVLQ